MKEIITDLEKLSARADEIRDIRKCSKEVQEIVLELKDTIREKNLKALSAPQIGYNKRIFVIRFGKNDLRSFVNPVIEYNAVKGLGLSVEESSSIPDKKFLIVRNSEVPALYQTPIGKIESKKFNGMAAYMFQQMMNHLDGIVLSDMGLEVGEDFLNATDEEKAPIISAYLDSLDMKWKVLEEEISKDSDLSEIRDAGKFLDKVNRGEVKLEVTEEKVPEIKKENE